MIAQGDEQQDQGWLEMQRLQAAALGTDLVKAEGSGHFIQFDRPDLVLDAIRAVVDEVRQDS